MSEVSCQSLSGFVRAAKARNIELERLLVGTTVSAATFADKKGRITWAEFVIIMRNIGSIWSPDELVEFGRDTLRNPFRTLSSAARLLFTATDFYVWVTAKGMGAGNQMFSCVEGKLERLDEHRLKIVLDLPKGYEVSKEFFYISRGTFMEMPTVLGLPPARVDLSFGEHSGQYLIDVPPGGGWLGKVKRAALYPFSARDVAKGLKEANESLQQRFFELESAKKIIDGQKAALEAVHAVTSAAHRNLELDPTLQAIVDEICRSLHYRSATISIDVVQDDVELKRGAVSGANEREGDAAVRAELRSGSRLLGTLSARSSSAISAEDERVFADVANASALAVMNSVSYEVIRSYRTDLELKVAARTAELSEAKDHIQRTLDSRNRFFANVNHELRTPLSVIMLATDQLAGNLAFTGQAREHLETARTNTERLRNLVDELMLLAAGAENKRNMRLASFGAGRLVEDLVSSVKPLAHKKGIELIQHVEPSLVLEGDARLVERALANLVTNAIKYTDEGRVEVRVQSEGPEVVFEVKDSGPGIPSEYLPRVFDRFFQVPFGPGKPGTGIGLALVKEIAAQHEGSVAVESAPGLGSTFRIKVPRKATEAVRARSERAPTSPGKPGWAPSVDLTAQPTETRTNGVSTDESQNARSHHRVLVVEDDADLLSQLATIFKAQGWSVDHVATGEAALERAQAHPPDLLVTDVDLGSGINGLELVKQFRAVKDHQNSPAIVLTANPTYGPEAAFEYGAVEFLEKPVRPNELVARVRALLAFRDVHSRMLATERLAAQGTALAGLSHELRNPLNGLINAIEPLRSMLPDEAVQPGTPTNELLAVIEECGERVAKLSSELLTLTRTDGAKYEPHPLTEVLERAIRATSHKLRPVELRQDISFDGLIRCSTLQLSQVLINLIENAVDAAGIGGWVMLKSASVDEKVFVEVRDSGPGVPRELRPRIFEPFFTTKAAGKGTGLGLAIARDIARRHGGDLELVEEGAFGVRLWLPSATAAVAVAPQGEVRS